MSERASRPSTVYRQLLKSGETHVTVFGAIPHHAQLAQATGYKVFGVSGSNVSTLTLGMPDAGLSTLTELTDCVRKVCQAVSIPVLVDGDTGFGNAINARRTVSEVIRAGAAGIFIEDQVAPKRCGFVKGKELIDIEEAVGKYRAACDVRDELDPDFIVMARSDARGAVGGSLQELIERGKAYLDAGVDVFYAEALPNHDEIREVREAFRDVPLVITIRPPLTQTQAREMGVCTTFLHIARVGAVAMWDLLVDQQQRGSIAWHEFLAKTEHHPLGGFGLFDLTGFPELIELEKKYLPKEKLERYDLSLGLYDPRTRGSGSARGGQKF